MRITKTKSIIGGVPDYYSISTRLWANYEKSGNEQTRILACHYARVAEEMGQAIIEDDTTVEISL